MSALAGPLPAVPARAILLRERFVFFSLVAVSCCLASAAGLLHGASVTALALAAIAVAMWHGAYDQVQGEQLLQPRLGGRWLPAFLGGYLVLAGLTLLGWWLLPTASLILFLGYSAWHFGTEPEGRTPGPVTGLAALALGALPIVAACRWHPDTVAPIFAAMRFSSGGGMDHTALVLTHALGLACWPTLAVVAVAIAAGRFGRGRGERLELLAVAALTLALFGFCDPLIAFAVYFCCWHTPEHLVATSLPGRSGETLGRTLRHNLRVGFVPWLLSLAALAVIFALGRHSAVAYRAEIFIVLSALTVPHMALNELRRIGPA